ncbi:MAG: hypothetical protein ACOCYV_01050 [Planctomycetota bacterium]
MSRTIVLLTALLFVACGGDSTDSTTYDGKQFAGQGYRIEAPTGWERRAKVMGCDVILVNPANGADDGFAENLNVVLENLPGSVSAEQYYDLTAQNLKQTFGQPVSERENCRLNGLDAHRIRYSMQMGDKNLDNDAYLIVRDGSAYVITLSMLEGESRRRHLGELTDIARTFRLE